MGIFQFLENLISDVQSLLGGVFVVAGLLIGIFVAVKGRGSVSSVVMGIITGGLIAALGVIIVSTSSLFEQEINKRAAGDETAQVRIAAAAAVDPLASSVSPAGPVE